MAPSEGLTDYDEIQQNEMEALKSIFMHDFQEEETKTVAWNVGDGDCSILSTCC